MTNQPFPVLAATGCQVRHLNQITKHEVAIKAQQRITVDQQRRNDTRKHRGKGKILRQSGFKGQPEQQAYAGQKGLADDARARNVDAMPFTRHGIGSRRINIRHWCQHQQRQTDLMNIAPMRLDRIGMGHFVAALDERKAQPDHHQHCTRRHMRLRVIGQVWRIHHHKHKGQRNHQPCHQPCNRTEQEGHERKRAIQKFVRIPQGNAECQRIQRCPFPTPMALLMLADDRRSIGLQVTDKQIGPEGLRKHANRITLGWQIVAVAFNTCRPDLVNGRATIASRDEAVGLLIEAQMTSGHCVGKHIPEFAANAMLGNRNTDAKLRLQVGDAIPLRAE